MDFSFLFSPEDRQACLDKHEPKIKANWQLWGVNNTVVEELMTNQLKS